MSKLYAVQIAPDMQESSTLADVIQQDVADNIISLYGNCYYEAHESDVFYQCRTALESCDIWDAVEEYKAGLTPYHSMVELFMDMLPPVAERGKYTIDEVKTMYGAICKYADCDLDFETAMVRLLWCVTGKAWHCTEIRGSVQGEWQMLYYDADVYHKKDIEYFETEYFNTGTEWCVAQLDEAPEDPADIMDADDAVWVYCHEWYIDGIRDEIRDNYGCNALTHVTMYKWLKYRQVSIYEEV